MSTYSPASLQRLNNRSLPPLSGGGTGLQMLLASVGILTLFGLIMVLSASSTAGLRMKDPNPLLFFQRQLHWAIVALLAGGAAAFFSYRRLIQIAPYLMGGTFLLLCLVFAPVIGGAFGGAHRWLRCGAFRIQPSEIAKLTLSLFVAWWALKETTRPLSSFKKGLMPPLCVILVMAGVVFIEPNVSTAGIIGVIGFSLLYLAGAKLRHLLPIGIGLCITVLVVAFLFFPHFRQRIEGHLGGEATRASYHSTQGLIALGNGGASGVGLGNSIQKFGYLPEAYTDFIFAVIGEELGFFGCTLIVIFFGMLLWAGYGIAIHSRSPQGRIVAAGITTTIGLEAMLNMMVVTKLIPTTGVALPFLSFGGSSLVINAVCIGVLVNIARTET